MGEYKKFLRMQNNLQQPEDNLFKEITEGPIIEDSIFKTVAAASIFIIVLLLIEYLKMKFDFFESLIAGKAVVLIENGELQEQNLKKHRLTVDQLYSYRASF
ncbi:DUF421 domain-containing protein [Bacillus licheniformis]|nr:DUF421 domain-containing protein [Bacillus licheniformis]